MGTLLLTICCFNFILGFAIAVYLHDPRLFRWPSRRKQATTQEAAERASNEASTSEPEQTIWVWPDDWRRMIESAGFSSKPGIETILQTVCLWLEIQRDSLVSLSADLRESSGSAKGAKSVERAVRRVAALGRPWSVRLQQAVRLIGNLPDAARHGVVEQCLFELQQHVDEGLQAIASANLEVEVHKGPRWLLADIGRMLEHSHTYRDRLAPMLAEVYDEAERWEDIRDEWTRDQLTGALNRIGFHQQFGQRRQSDTPGQVCAFRIDRFQRINSQFGPEQGDRLLRLFSKLLADVTRRIEEVKDCSRVSGATMAFFLDTETMEPEAIAERIRQQFEAASFLLFRRAVQVTVSSVIVDLASVQTACELASRIEEAFALPTDGGGNRTGRLENGATTLAQPYPVRVRARIVRRTGIELVV